MTGIIAILEAVQPSVNPLVSGVPRQSFGAPEGARRVRQQSGAFHGHRYLDPLREGIRG